MLLEFPSKYKIRSNRILLFSGWKVWRFFSLTVLVLVEIGTFMLIYVNRSVVVVVVKKGYMYKKERGYI